MKYTIYKTSLLCGLIFIFAAFTFAQTERGKGVELYSQGDFKGAVESLQKSVETYSKDRDSWLYLGMALVRQNQVKNAVKAFQKADSLKVDEPVGDYKKIKFIAKPRATYTDSARGNQTQGKIKLAVEFGADGKIGFIFPFKKLEYGLTENAIIAAGKIRFEPATKNGNSTTGIAIVEYNFTTF